LARKQKTEDIEVSFLTELRSRIKEHRLPIFAAAVAFFGFIAMIPALAAAVSITGLVADTDVLITEVESALEASPEETRNFLTAQIRSIADGSDSGAGIAAVVGIALSLFSASGAVGQLMEALNVVFDRRESRNFVIKRLTALGLLFGTIVTLAAMVFAMTVVPALINSFVDSPGVSILINVGRFVGLGLFMVFALTVLYRVGPSANVARQRELVPGGKGSLLSKGAVLGTVLIVLASWGFGFFANNFGSYNETYGTLAAIVVVLLWLQLLALAVLVGAEAHAIMELRRVREARSDAGLSRDVPVLDYSRDVPVLDHSRDVPVLDHSRDVPVLD